MLLEQLERFVLTILSSVTVGSSRGILGSVG